MADSGINNLIAKYNRLEKKVDERTGKLTTIFIIVVGLACLALGFLAGAVLV